MTAAVNEQPTWSPFRGPWLIKLFLMKANNFNIHSVILSNHNSDDFLSWALYQNATRGIKTHR